MSQTGWVDPRIESVRAAAIRNYLCSRGWTLQEYPGPELLVFQGPKDDDGEPRIQVVPSNEHYRDFRMRVEELLGALSVLENRPARDIVDDLLSRDNNDQAQPGLKPSGPKRAVG